MLKASKYCSPTPPSRGRVLWSLIPAEFRKDMTGGVNYRDTQRCECTEISVRISAGGFIPSSWLWLTTGSLPRGHSVLLNNVGKAGFVCEKWWSGAPCCKKRGSRCILDSNLKGTGMPFFGIGTAENIGQNPIFSTGVPVCTLAVPLPVTSWVSQLSASSAECQLCHTPV